MMLMDFHIQIQKLIQVKWLRSGNRHAEGVADKVAYVMILEELRLLGEDRALRRFLDIGLDPDQSFLTGFVEELIHHLQGFNVALFGEFGTGKNSADAACDAFKN